MSEATAGIFAIRVFRTTLTEIYHEKQDYHLLTSFRQTSLTPGLQRIRGIKACAGTHSRLLFPATTWAWDEKGTADNIDI